MEGNGSNWVGEDCKVGGDVAVGDGDVVGCRFGELVGVVCGVKTCAGAEVSGGVTVGVGVGDSEGVSVAVGVAVGVVCGVGVIVGVGELVGVGEDGEEAGVEDVGIVGAFEFGEFRNGVNVTEPKLKSFLKSYMD